jgi:hypothetical protein
MIPNQTWDEPFGPGMPQQKEFIIHTMPMPDWMKAEQLKAQALLREASYPGRTKFAEASIKRYAQLYGQLIMTRFIYENLNSPLVKKLELAHAVTVNPETGMIEFIRAGSKTPGILEKMKLYSDLDL